MALGVIEMAHPPSRPTSRLESLPVEIIQLIFLHSLEINLPRASLPLSRALSRSLLYTWLIRLAFSSPNRSSRQGFFTGDFLPPPLDFWSLAIEKRQDLQSAILECRWCTLELVRKCQREFVIHVIRTKCGDLTFQPEDEAILANLDPYFDSLSNYVPVLKGKGDLVLRGRKEDGSRWNVGIWFYFGAVQIRPAREVFFGDDIFILPCSDAMNPGRVPDKLLCEPWTNDKLQFLELLARSFYIPKECCQRIVARLIRKRQFEPFCRLLRLQCRPVPCRVPEPWPLPNSVHRLVEKYGSGRGSGDRFSHFLVEERWIDMSFAERDQLILYNIAP